MVRADIHADDERTIESFVDGIWMERGLARNTLAAYKRDLEHLARFLSGRNETLTGVSRASLMEYLAQHEGEVRLRVACRPFVVSFNVRSAKVA